MSKQSQEEHLLGVQKLNQLQSLLPTGTIATNTVAAKKSVGKAGCKKRTEYWTSWCKDKDGHSYLALLDDNNEIKLLSECKDRDGHSYFTLLDNNLSETERTKYVCKSIK